tara:strand:+ start:4160 stop:8617 length:4458 start_codon:yes stop_codon:yes gene_type:complete
MAEKVTYESLQEDTDFLNNAYFFLKDMGERVSSDPKDILDTFIEKRRAFDTNIFSTYSQGTDIAEAPNAVKLNYRAAIDKLDQMPDFYEKGGAPTGGALLDYAYYGATDPTNLLSILAGAFTLPAGGSGAAGIFAAKEAAKAGFRAKLKASVSKPVLKAMALEGTIAGAGGATQGVLSQETDMDIGRREKGDYDYTNIALQGLLEGTLSPVAGIALNLAGSGIVGGTKAIVPKGVAKLPGGKKINESAKWGSEWLKRNFLPPSSQDKQAQRIFELTNEEFKPILVRTEKNSKLIDGAEKNFAQSEGEVVARDITNDVLEGNDIDIDLKIQQKEGQINNLNTKLQEAAPEDTKLIEEQIADAKGDRQQLDIYKQRNDAGLYQKFRDMNEGIDETMREFYADIKVLQQEGSETPYISNFLDETYFKTDRYLRDIYEKFHTSRESFDKFIERPENKNLIEDYKNFLLSDDRKLMEMGVLKQDAARRDDFTVDGTRPPSKKEYAEGFKNKDGSLDMVAFERAVLEDKTHGLKELYKPILSKQAKYGATYKIKDVPEVIKQIYGRNFSPAVRMMETTQGLINTITDLRMYGSLVDNLQARSTKENPLIIRAESDVGARNLAIQQGADPNTEWVPLKTEYNMQKGAEPVFNDDGTRIDFYDFDLNNPDAVFVIPGRMLDEDMGGQVQLPERTDFVSEEVARQLDDDFYSGVMEPGSEISATRRYAYERDVDGKLLKDQNGNPVIKRNSNGKPAIYAVGSNGKVLPVDVQKRQVYVPKEFAKRFKEMLNTEQLIEPLAGKLGSGQRELMFALNSFAEMQGYLKKGKTVYNPIAIVRNILGAAGYMMNTGNYSGLMRLANLYTTGTKEQKEALMAQAQRLGLKGSQIEINQILNRIGKKQVGIKGGIKEIARRVVTGQVLGLLEDTKLDRALINFYGVTDDFGKLGTWMSEKAAEDKIWKQRPTAEKEALRDEFINSTIARNTFKRKKQLDEIVEALEAKRSGQVLNAKGDELIEKLDDALRSEIAAQKALDVVPVYSRIPKILEKLRGIPIIGNFSAFPAENLRNKYQLFKIAGDEIRTGFETGNTALVQRGSKRLLSQAGYAAAPATMAYFYNQMEGTSEAADAIREGLMDYQKDHAIAVRKDKNGKFYYTDLSYSNTDAAVLDIITPFLASGARGEDLGQVLDEIFPRAAWNYLSSFMEPSLATNVVQDFVSYAQAPTDEERGSILARIGKTMTPGVLKSIAEISADLGAFSENETLSSLERTFRPLFYGEDRKRFEDSADLSSWLARHGFNIKGFGDFDEARDYISGPALASFGIVSGEKEFDPKKTFAYISRSLQKNVLEDLQKTKQEMVAKIGDPTLVYNKENLLKEYNELFEEQFVAQQGIAKLIGLYSNILPSNQLQSIIRDPAIKGSLSKKQIGNINKNKFYPEDLSKDFVEKIRQAYVKAYGKGKVPQEEFNSIISDMRRLHNLWRFKPLDIEDPEGQVEAQQ